MSGKVDMKLEALGIPVVNWPDWYAEYLVREPSGEALPT
jgi:hypothetical protein